MNLNTFGEAPSEGDVENDWGLYTNPESILGLQFDFGADIVATLDYPVPPKLNEQEREERSLVEREILDYGDLAARVAAFENGDRDGHEFVEGDPHAHADRLPDGHAEGTHHDHGTTVNSGDRQRH